MPDIRSDAWWVAKLDKALDARRPTIDRLNRYYEGDHPLPLVPERVGNAFQRWLKMSRSNWMGLVVEAVAERLAVQGIRYGRDQAADGEAWDGVWQANQLDTGSELVHLEALICGESYVTVEPGPDGPRVLPEHPSQVIVATDPAMPGVRRAAWKKWVDDSEMVFATLYLPDRIVRLRSTVKVGALTGGSKVVWVPREETVVNPVGQVPVIPFSNRARLLAPGRSEIADLLDSQDRINETLFMRVMATQYSSFRQRAASGLPLDTDPNTGLPMMPFKPTMTDLWVSENPETRWHEFSETSLGGYIEAVEADVQHIAAQSHTPPHYLLGKMANLSGDALKAVEAGLVSKVRRRMVHFGESWESMFRLAFLVQGDQAKAGVSNSEIVWRNPEFRSDAALADATVKLHAEGLLPTEMAQEKIGMSPGEIERAGAFRAMDALFSAPPVPPVLAPEAA